MSSALKAINKRVKQLQKKHPKSKRTTLQKQAGREYRAGKLKSRRKVGARKATRKKARKAAVKRTVVVIAGRRRKAPRRRVGAVKFVEARESVRAKPSRVYRVKRTKKGTYKGVRRVSGMSRDAKDLLWGVGIAGAILIASQALRPKPVAPQIEDIPLN